MKGLKSRKDGDKEVEHPKPQVEFLEASLTTAQNLASANGLTLDQALNVLIFNELRCIHYHFDVGVVTRTASTGEMAGQTKE